MQISFEVDGLPTTFRWTGFISSAKITTAQEVIELQNPWRFSSQFSLRMQRVWRCQVHGHEIKTVKVRPLWLAGVRKSLFTVYVDEHAVASANGR